MALERLCDDAELARTIAQIEQDEAQGTYALERLMRDHPDDPRLHFLRGSLHASQGAIDRAARSMAHAVAIAPDYAIARFQFGLLQLSSGDAAAAASIWEPLHALDEQNPLRVFATGLEQMAADQLDKARATLCNGLALNLEMPVLNRDMQLVIDEIDKRIGGDQDASIEASSSTAFLLHQASLKSTRH